MSENKRQVTRVKLIDARTQNTTVFEIPAFREPPQWVSRHQKVYLLQSPGTYVEAFGYPLAFNSEPVK